MAEKEYIEREALTEHIKDLPTWDYIAKADGVYEKSTKYPEGNFNCDDVINSINNAPAADVEEVVRCKDCLFSKPYKTIGGNDGYYCQNPNCTFTYGTNWERIFEPVRSADDFCSYGERRPYEG